MKKIISLLVLVLLVFSLSGCENKGKEAINILETEFIAKFGDNYYEDLEYPKNEEVGIIKGESTLLNGAISESISVIIVANEKMAMIEIVLKNESTLNKQLVWNVMLTYMDRETKTYIYLDFYETTLFGNYKDYSVAYNFYDLVELFSHITIKDVETLFYNLGYRHIK